MDLSEYTLASRPLVLAAYSAAGWRTAALMIWPQKYAARVNSDGYRAAIRTWRWFNWQPGPRLRLLITLAGVMLGVYAAFPEFFGM